MREPGSYSAVTILDVPVLMVRGQDGSMRAFLNVCSHRGAQLTDDGCGTARRFTCPASVASKSRRVTLRIDSGSSWIAAPGVVVVQAQLGERGAQDGVHVSAHLRGATKGVGRCACERMALKRGRVAGAKRRTACALEAGARGGGKGNAYERWAKTPWLVLGGSSIVETGH
jgi:nitrite reductase/ring-hydroxylating ferredoxin subunit